MSADPAVERAIRERVATSDFARWFGMEFVRFADGEAELSLELAPHHLNPGGIIHGGVIATLLDGAIGLALRTRLGLGSQHVTLHLDVQYLAMAKDGVVVARGTAVHTGRRAAYGEATLHSHDGRLLAKGSATFMIVEPESLPNTPFADG